MRIKKLNTLAGLISVMLTALGLVGAVQQPAAAQSNAASTTIYISGKLCDASTLSPVANASVQVGGLTVTTAANGQFFATLQVPASKLSFAFTVKKAGYIQLHDSENWGTGTNSDAGVKKAMLFVGIDKNNREKQFVLIKPYGGAGTYNSGQYLDEAFKTVTKTNHLDEAALLRDSLKANPAGIYFVINNLHFIAGNYGWVLVDGGDDLVNINGQTIKASALNARYHRSIVKGLTTVEPGNGLAKVKIEVGK